jgi:hypothetical protein
MKNASPMSDRTAKSQTERKTDPRQLSDILLPSTIYQRKNPPHCRKIVVEELDFAFVVFILALCRGCLEADDEGNKTRRTETIMYTSRSQTTGKAELSIQHKPLQNVP